MAALSGPTKVWSRDSGAIGLRAVQAGAQASPSRPCASTLRTKSCLVKRTASSTSGAIRAEPLQGAQFQKVLMSFGTDLREAPSALVNDWATRLAGSSSAPVEPVLRGRCAQTSSNSRSRWVPTLWGEVGQAPLQKVSGRWASSPVVVLQRCHVVFPNHARKGSREYRWRLPRGGRRRGPRSLRRTSLVSGGTGWFVG